MGITNNATPFQENEIFKMKNCGTVFSYMHANDNMKGHIDYIQFSNFNPIVLVHKYIRKILINWWNLWKPLLYILHLIIETF